MNGRVPALQDTAVPIRHGGVRTFDFQAELAAMESGKPSPRSYTRIPDPGNRLAEFMRDQGLTETSLARAAGLKQSYINRLKNGRIKTPTIRVARRVAAALGHTIEEVWPESTDV